MSKPFPAASLLFLIFKFSPQLQWPVKMCVCFFPNNIKSIIVEASDWISGHHMLI